MKFACRLAFTVLPALVAYPAAASQSEEWKKELDANNWQSNYRNSRDTARYYESEYAEMKAVLGELGLARQ